MSWSFRLSFFVLPSLADQITPMSPRLLLSARDSGSSSGTSALYLSFVAPDRFLARLDAGDAQAGAASACLARYLTGTPRTSVGGDDGVDRVPPSSPTPGRASGEVAGDMTLTNGVARAHVGFSRTGAVSRTEPGRGRCCTEA